MKDVLERIRRVAEKETREVTEEALPRARRATVSGLRGHEGSVESACVLAGGDGIVTACEDASVRVYSLSGGEPIHTLDMHDDWATGVAALGEDVVASVGCDGMVVTWEAKTGKLIEKCRIREHDNRNAVIAHAGIGKLVVGTSSGELHLLEHTAGRALRYTARLRRAHNRKIDALAWNNGVLIVGSADRCASIWEGRRCVARLAHTDSIHGVDINKNRVVTMMREEVRVYERGTWRLLRVLRGLHGYDKITSVVLLNNDVLLSTGHDARVLFTRISDATPLARYRANIERPDGVTVAPGGRIIVTSGYANHGVVLEIDGADEATIALREFCDEQFQTIGNPSNWWVKVTKPMLVVMATMVMFMARRSLRQQQKQQY